MLGCEKFDACLLREWDRLDEAQRDHVIDRMIHAQQVGLVDRIGVAAYTREDVRTFREHLHRADHEVGALQVPSNPIDRRFDDDDDVHALATCGADLAVRSVFLQGCSFRKIKGYSLITRICACIGHMFTTALPGQH